MRVEVCSTPQEAATRAAELIAECLREAIARSGNGTVALSGGRTPSTMLQELASAPLDWSRIHIFQVDERLVDDGDERSNMKTIRSAFERPSLAIEQMHHMQIHGDSPQAGADRYTSQIRLVAGNPPTFDVVHLGLGEDGHTASLFPGDSALDADGDVAVTGIHGGVRRMTLTLKVINRARSRVWLVTGNAKRNVVQGLLRRDLALIASRVDQDNSSLVIDREASAGEA